MKAKLAALVLLIAATAATAGPYYISKCITGPKPDSRIPCRQYDYDQDGDVDLLDFAEYQIEPDEWQ